MVSGKLLGLEEGIEQCKSLNCSVCGKVGASVGCTHHGCEETVHVGCGQGGGGWLMDEDKLDAKCPGHNLRNDTKQRQGRKMRHKAGHIVLLFVGLFYQYRQHG